MRAALEWAGDHDEEPAPASLPLVKLLLRPGDALPRHVAAAIWRGDELGSPITSVVSSGFPALDAELPGHGWPCRSLTEVLQAQPSVAEWRLLAPALRLTVALGQDVVPLSQTSCRFPDLHGSTTTHEPKPTLQRIPRASAEQGQTARHA